MLNNHPLGSFSFFLNLCMLIKGSGVLNRDPLTRRSCKLSKRKAPGPLIAMNASSSDSEMHERLYQASQAFKLSHGLSSDELTFLRASGGVNNLTAFVCDGSHDQKLFVIRIYIHTTAAALERVIWEGQVLLALAKVMEGTLVSFQIPKPVLHPETKATYAILGDGSISSACHVIPGSLCTADPNLARSLGQAAGELSNLMSRVRIEDLCPLPPVHDIYAAHPLMSKEAFLKAVQRKELDVARATIDVLVGELRDLEIEVKGLINAGSLIKQLIHADLHHENALSTSDGKISGIIDFEFAAMDWRAQDLAICLSKYVSEPEPLLPIAEFCYGWKAVCPLTAEEIDALPTLIRLRILSNVVFFIGRWMANEAAVETLIGGRAQAYVKRLEWIKAHEADIKASIS